MARDFAAGSASHAVTDDEGPGYWSGSAGVLIIATNTPAIRQHCVDELIGCHEQEKRYAQNDTRKSVEGKG